MTTSPSKRRPFLKGMALTLAALAGCIDTQSNSTEESPTPTDTETEATTPTDTAIETKTATDTETATDTKTKAPSAHEWFVDRGEVFDSFTDLENWSVIAGEASLEGDGFLEGDAVRMDASDSTRVRIARSFGSSEDLSGYDFSLAMKLEESTRESQRVSVVLEDTGGRLQRHSMTTLTTINDRWVHLDMAFEKEDDGFDATSVSELYIDHYAGSATSVFAVDDLRLLEKPEKGAVIFTFDDACSGEYTEAYPTLSDYGYAGVCFPPSQYVHDTSSPSTEQYREMADGWDVHGHTPNHGRLSDYSAAEQLELFEHNVDQLRELGLVDEDEPIHFRTPYGNYDAGTLDVVLEEFATCISGAGSAAGSSFHVTDPRMIGYRSGEDMENAKALVDKAVEHRQLLGFTFHMCNIDGEHMEELASYVHEYESNDEIDVLTMSEFYERSDLA